MPVGTVDDSDEKSWWRKMFEFKPEDLFNRKVSVFFMDPLSLELAPTNNKAEKELKKEKKKRFKFKNPLKHLF